MLRKVIMGKYGSDYARECRQRKEPLALEDIGRICPDCYEPIIASDDDAGVCIQCGGRNRRASAVTGDK